MKYKKFIIFSCSSMYFLESGGCREKIYHRNRVKVKNREENF